MKEEAKILLVDDSAFMRSVLKNILSEAGIKNFEEAENGKEALEKMEKFAPDLILMDLIMPEMGGIDVLKKIGKNRNVIVISAVGQEKIIEEAKALGAISFIVKPFDNDQVVSEVSKILK